MQPQWVEGPRLNESGEKLRLGNNVAGSEYLKNIQERLLVKVEPNTSLDAAASRTLARKFTLG